MGLMRFVRRWRFSILHCFFCLFFAILLLLICAQIPLVSNIAFWMFFISPIAFALIANYGEQKILAGEAKPGSLWYYFEKNSLEKEGLGHYQKQKL